jgi:hypothetical protein
MEAAFLGHARLGGHIDLAGRVLADDHDGDAGSHARSADQLVRQFLHAGDHLGRHCLAIYRLGHPPPPSIELVAA